MLPTLDATTTAVFASTGLNAATIYSTLIALLGTGLSFGLWLIQVMFPILLVTGFVFAVVSVIYRFTGLGR